MSKFQDLIDDLLYYKHKTNWHKHPWVARLLCSYGAHDYEFVSGNDDYGLLECFYCLHKKISYRKSEEQ